MSAGHTHALPSNENERALRLALALTSGFLVTEVVGGVLTGSLALISDAAHMFTDAAALAIALAAVRIARRPADARRTYGYHRFEILAAAFNALLLFAVALLAGEAAFGALAWIVAHALTLDARARAERVRAFAPYVIVAAVWFALYRGLGYGAAGGGYYVDPLRQPVEFAKALATRMPVLLLLQFALPTADLWMQQPLRVQVAAAAGAWEATASKIWIAFWPR